MIKAIVFLVKVALLVALAVWVADRPGTVAIEWMEYKLTLQMGVFLLLFVLTVLLAIAIFGIIKGVADFPKSFRRYREYVRRDKGYKALTLGLTAVAAGDAISAQYQAHRATKMLRDDNGLPLLLKAQAARMNNKEDEAREAFALLIQDKNAAFLGVRGLLQAALDAQNYSKALELGREALRLHPKQPWILRMVYDLEIKMQDWEAARKTLYRAEKAGAVEARKAKSDRVAMLLAEADAALQEDHREQALHILKKAHGIDPSFAPAVTRLAKMHIQNSQRRRAVSIIEKAWKVAPHPELVYVWDMAAPAAGKKSKTDDIAMRIKWFERLMALKPDSNEGHLALAQAAMDDGLWGEARAHLREAEKTDPSRRVYRMLIALEERSTQDEEAIMRWSDKADEAAPDRQWVCRETGRVYPQWSPVALPHNGFNTIEWAVPDAASAHTFLAGGGVGKSAMIEAPGR